MDSPYVDPGLGMSMDLNVEQSMGNTTGTEVPSMNLYNQSPFNQAMMSSPIHTSASQGTPHSAHAPSQEPGAGSGVHSQYGGILTHSRPSNAQLSRSQSLHIPDSGSPAQSSTPMSQPASAPPQNQANSGFRGQPQHPTPGSRQDVGMGNTSQMFDGVNGPVPVNASNYNPNYQNFNWEAPEGGWPSTMVGRPHMQTSYKNAYSSTGFDMLGVLVCI